MRKYIKKINEISIIVLAIAFMLGLGGIIAVHAVAPPNRGLGLADRYSVFGKAGVTTTGVTHVWGNAGADSSVGLITSQVGGSINVAPASDGVETDARSTYMSLMDASQGIPADPTFNMAGTHTTLNGNPITPGVYNIAASIMNGDIELSGDGVYIFRSTSSVTSATSAAHMTLTHGACASNVFWAIPASMTIGTGAHIEGTIIASTGSITILTGATLVGRAISLIASVTLDANQITEPTCSTTGTLHVIKTLNNLHGGTLGKADFSFSVNSGTPVAFEPDGQNDITVDAGTYSVTESAVAGYATSYNTCTGLIIAAGGSATCTITNDDIAPKLHLRKIINGGTATVADFPLMANGTGVNDISGISPVDSGAGLLADTFVLSETNPGGYTPSSWVCVGGTQVGSNITLSINQEATCTITNTYILPVVHYSSSGSSVVPVFEPTITILSTPVVVDPIIPKLPKTGFPPRESNTWYEFLFNNILNLFR